MTKFKYKQLKPGARSKTIYGDQIYEKASGGWRDTAADFTVSKRWKVRRPDKKSLEVIKEIKLLLEKNKKIVDAAYEIIYGSWNKARKSLKEVSYE